MSNPEPFTYEWFKSLTDKELVDIALLEATWDHSHFDGQATSPTQRDLLAALAHRVFAQGFIDDQETS